MAESTGFVSCFLKGVVDRSSYRILVADLYFVYFALEAEIGKLREQKHPVVAPVGFPELNRCEALEQDLIFYFGRDWRNLVKPTPAAEAYVARIHKLAEDSPELLVAHHYTRYLGDLSGGQILMTIAKKAMKLVGNDGVRFYIFDEIADPKTFKACYGATLDSLPIDQITAEQMVDEANRAFQCNMAIFKELEGNLVAAIGKVVFGFLTQRSRSANSEGVVA